jgi:hypothetical protein
VVSGFRREVDENCALLDYYAASSSNFEPTFLYNLLQVQFGAQMSRPDSIIIRMILFHSLASNKIHMCAVTNVVIYVLFVYLRFIITIIQSTKQWTFFDEDATVRLS